MDGLLIWFADFNYRLMVWTNLYYFLVFSGLVFVAGLIGMSPLKTHHEHPFYQIIFVYIRKCILYFSFLLCLMPFVMLYLYDVTMKKNIADSQKAWLNWFLDLTLNNWFTVAGSALCGLVLRFLFKRYALPFVSGILRKFRNQQINDLPSDIRAENGQFKEKDFKPHKKYKKDRIFIGLDLNENPIYVPIETWHETNMQVIGPTRYGKGVIIGNLLDQSIKNGDCLFYIDPKNDKFAPHIMYQAALKSGRKFYYLTLHDKGVGKWAPFAGGTLRESFSRLESAFGLELTGDPGTDYYKTQEVSAIEPAFKKTRNIESLKALLADTDANRINAELKKWSNVESLCPKKNTGFSIEKAIKENAVVYVQGSLDDSVVKTATKVFIAELIQQARSLKDERKTHLTTIIDEVSFLASKTLAQALATTVGFRANFVLAYQSQDDLTNLDDKNVNAKYVSQSINVNCQLKAIHGGSDFETAEWVANMSGTIMKEITKLEKTDISDTGGETWNNQRMVGFQEENYINTNTILSLPPRVCVFIQPRSLASICFSSFVPVQDMEKLNKFLDHKNKVYSSKNNSDKDSISQAKLEIVNQGFLEDQEEKESDKKPSNLKKTESKSKTNAPIPNKPNQGKKTPTDNNSNNDAKTPTPNKTKPENNAPIPKKSDFNSSESTPNKPKLETNNTSSNEPKLEAQKTPSSDEIKPDKSEQDIEELEEIELKKAANKSRRERQKKRKMEDQKNKKDDKSIESELSDLKNDKDMMNFISDYDDGDD